MNDYLPLVIFWTGVAQLCVLVASALVPTRLQWNTSLADLPRLHRQLYWVYGGYVVMAIIGNGLIAIVNADELAAGSLLARCVCGYIAIFWSVRLSLQTVLEVKEHLTTWWLTAGYHTLTLLFVSFTVVFGYAALHPHRNQNHGEHGEHGEIQLSTQDGEDLTQRRKEWVMSQFS